MKKVLALLMALVLILSFTACSEKPTVVVEESSVTAKPISDEDAKNILENIGGGSEEVTNADGEVVTEVVTDASGEAVTEVVTDASGETVTNASGEAVTEAITETVTEVVEIDYSKKTKQEILDFYSLATNMVVKEKPGYTKTRSAGNETYEAGVALMAFKDLVFQFLGIGEANKFEAKVEKDKNTTDEKCGDFLKQSTLTEADVKSAKIEKSGENLIVTLEINPGTSYIEGGEKASNNSPIDRTGICTGNTDRSGFDHKSAPLVYNAIADFAGGAVISEESHNGKVVATITPEGKIVNLVITWDASAKLTKVAGSKGDIAATTTVTYTNFGW